jgi:UDP-N-acetylmuramoyl-L-alanyl-D-glutamate--2,6-diaminopimelate ligase
MSDFTIVTSDNPRFEEPDEIIHEILKGIEKTLMKNILVISDREQAIKTACSLAQQGDIILVAGKGHETYQEIKGIKNDFDDRKIINKYLSANI